MIVYVGSNSYPDGKYAPKFRIDRTGLDADTSLPLYVTTGDHKLYDSPEEARAAAPALLQPYMQKTYGKGVLYDIKYEK